MSDYELINGDCIKEMQKLIDDGVKVDLIVTDPPYLMNYSTNHSCQYERVYKRC